MKHFYAIVEILYYILTIFVGVFFLKWELWFNDSYSTLLFYIIPWYMILCGIMFGYIIAKFRILHADDISKHNSILLQSFIIGIVLGVWLSLAYVFFK